MAENSHISWTDHTFNPWIGCTKIGPACDGCYAEAMMGDAGRYQRVTWGKPGQKATHVRTAPSTWKQPLKWNREAAKKIEAWREYPFDLDGTDAPKPTTFVFCASLADVFDNDVDPAWRFDLFELIRATPHLTWLLLTKRPQNIVKLYLQAHPAYDPEFPGFFWPRNAAIGCTVVTQKEADRDVSVLMEAKAALKPAFAFVSMEPLLEAVMVPHLHPLDAADEGLGFPAEKAVFPALDWVIAGGETDQGAHKARPSSIQWYRELRDQCAAAGVPFHFKQWGEWAPAMLRPSETPGHFAFGDYSFDRNRMMETDAYPRQFTSFGARSIVERVGKKAAGRLLDGKLHDARPEVNS